MNKIIFSFLFLCHVSFYAAGQQNCTLPHDISSFPFSANNLTTLGMGNDYNMDPICSTGPKSNNGEDYVFKLNVSEQSVLDVTLNLNNTITGRRGIYLVEGCPDTGVCVVSQSNGSDVQFSLSHTLQAQQDYFLIIKGESTINFNISINRGQIPECTINHNPMDGAQNIYTQTLTWEHPDIGMVDEFNVYYGTTSPPPFLGTTQNTHMQISTTPGETYYWKVDAKIGINPSENCQELIFTQAVQNPAIPKVIVDGGLKINTTERINQFSSNVTMADDGTLTIRKYEIGDLAYGGIIFFVDESGEHGLVAALDDFLYDGTSYHSVWCYCDGSKLSNFSFANGLYAGKVNTMNAYLIHNENPNLYIAFDISNEVIQGFGDWYLPSTYELELMYNNLHGVGLGNFAEEVYWSSTEDILRNYSILCIDFKTGNQVSREKIQYLLRSRPIRSF